MTLTTGLLIALVIPLFFAIMSVATGNFYYNILMTGSCVVLLLASPGVMVVIPIIVCLAVSILADYFMGHQHESSRYYLFGAIGFFIAHLCLIWYSIDKVNYATWQLIVGGMLAVGYGLYLAFRILSHVPHTGGQLAIALYSSVSVIALAMAVGLRAPMPQLMLYALSVASTLFSDTMICECDFAGNQRLSRSIMPSYFLGHLLLTAACLVGMMPKTF